MLCPELPFIKFILLILYEIFCRYDLVSKVKRVKTFKILFVCNSLENFLSEAFQQICCCCFRLIDNNIYFFFFYFYKSYFSDLQFNIGPTICENEFNSFSQNLDMSQHKLYSTWIINQVSLLFSILLTQIIFWIKLLCRPLMDKNMFHFGL